MADKHDEVEVTISIPALVGILVVLGLLIFGVVYLYGQKSPAGNGDKKQPETIEESVADVNNVSLENLDLKGNSSAKFVFLIVSDFECPLCQYFENGLPGKPSIASQIKTTYVDSGLARYALVPYVVRAEHNPAAANEIQGYFCAVDQQKGYEYVDKVFSKTKTNGLGIDGKRSLRSSLIDLSKELGLDEKKFTSCYDLHDTTKADDIQQRVNNQIRAQWVKQNGNWFGTPTVMICKINQDNPHTCSGKAFVGAFPFEDIQKIVKEIIH